MRWLRAVLVTFVCALILETHAFHPDGVDHEADLLCHVCNASYYCLNGQQFDCPAHSLAAVALADTIDECVCLPGYLREGDLCNLGQPPAWYMYGNRSFCVHTRETIAAGASGHADCVCVPGFAGLPAAEPVHCEACPADTFADVHNTSECVPCPAYASHNETRRANVTACLCDPGYTGPDGGPCVACAAGTFKAQPGAAACEDCGVNEYSYSAAAVCVACHGNSSSLPRSPGVDHCLCDPGFYPSEGLCSMCHAGRFKNTTANEPCQSCTGNTFASELGATACTSCLVSSPFSTANPSEGGVRCQCIAGYTQTELNLVTPECSACPPDTFQPSQGQTTCELCDPNARSPEASVTPLACLCNAGFTDNSEHECLVCAGGTYKEAAADDEDDTELCNVCPDDSFSLAQSGRLVDCLCDPGFSGSDGGPCSACAPGKFKAANGSAACEDCPLHTYSDEANSTACKSCTQFLDFGGITFAPGRDSSDDCECDVSQGFSTVYVGGARKCTGCKAGTYASAEGCRNCSNGTFNDEGAQTTCKQCPVNASSYDYPHVSCQCHKGFFCQQQPQITHDYTKSFNAYNDGGLKFIVINGIDRLLFAYDALVTTSLQHKEMNAFFSTYYGLVFVEYWGKTFAGQLPECLPSMTLIPCQKIMSSISFFSNSQKILNAFRVYIFKWFVYQNNGAGQYYWFQCASYFEAYTQCALFDGEFTSIGNSGVSLNAILSFRSIHLQDPRTCADGLCAACTMDTFKDYTGGAGSCIDCQAYSQSIPASTSQDMCLCKRGYRQDGPTVCVACAAGTYSDDLDELACSVCPADTYTPTASYPWDTPGDCQACAVCNQTTNPAFRDHYDAARAGVGCGLDQPSSCQACPAAASLFLPTTESQRNKGVQSCVCDAHFYGAKGAACAACPSNQVRPDLIDAATTLADCLCAPGFEPDPGSVNLCRQCSIGTYKTYAGDHNCTACPATLTTAQTGNANASACVCAPGFAFDGARCNICPDNLYKIGFNLIQACTACTANSFGPAGGTGPLDCSCLFGFEPYTGMCIPCTPGKHKNSTVNLGQTVTWTSTPPLQINLARACSAGDCPVTSSSVFQGTWIPERIVNGIMDTNLAGLFVTNFELNPWVMVDMQQTVFVAWVRVYNRLDDATERLNNFEIRIGDSSLFSNNPRCGGLQNTFRGYRDFNCVYSGRYLSLQILGSEYLHLVEIEVYGTKPPTDEHLYKCSVCPQNTATNNTGTVVCDACAAGKTTDGRTGQVECVCDVGTEPGAGGVCQTCRAGTYKAASTDKYANRACVNCSSCAAGQQVATECNSTHNITCRACQPNSWSSAGRTLLNPCFCNAGYELQGELCVACPVGKARQANYNNSIRCEVCGPGFANTSTQSTCHPCSEICEDVLVPPPRFFVLQECNASRDVVCQQCQTCAAGFYANNTCGVSYGNDRLDTQCAVCPADSYCPGGSVTQAALPCPDNGKSAPGSDAIADCTCDPGYSRSGDLCVICPLDFYCPRGVFQPIACPAPGRTFYEGSAVRLDCHCPRGHFRDPPGDEERFNCSLCTPDDYCFNNSLYNCSDALMESEPGSGFFDNCTCVNRYYNNGTRCEDCNVDFSCVGGRQHACPALEWTNRLTRQEACVCRPSFVRAGAECVPCADDFFCDGSDDREHPCPSRTVGRAATNVSECLCNVSFEVVHSNNVSEPHSCRECSLHFFKNSISNTLCQPCTRCLPQEDSVWTRIVCDAGYDAMCDSCTVCHDAAAADTPAEQWAGVDCQEFADTVCFNCTLCDYSEQWEKAPCAETRDRECSAIQRGRPCEVGQYAGNHSRTTDSQCLPCAMNDTLYEGQRLHFYTSAGRRYDDLTSCDIACRQYSRLRDINNPALGCVSCETGNVLFKVFTQNDLACTFTCLEGYVRTEDDCVPAPLQPSVSNFWNHTLNVTHVRRVSSNAGAAFRFTISHTAHGSFAVVIGQAEPSCASLAPVLLHGTTACCFSGLWRVSTKNQLGLGASAEEKCSAPNAPFSARLSDSQLEFDVPDSRLTELALCNVVQNSSFGELACVLQVSIVDTVFLLHVAVAVTLELRRGAALAFMPGAHTYVPLLAFHAEVQLAYMDAGRPVFLVVSDLAPLPDAGATEVGLASALERVDALPGVNCGRYTLNSDFQNTAQWTLDGGPARASVLLRADVATSDNLVLKLYYTLRLLEREGGAEDAASRNTMNVAVWRNVSLDHAVCETTPPPLKVRMGEVLTFSGLGAYAASTATALHEPTETVRGELGGLTTFVARALVAHVRRVHPASLLAAFTLPAAAPLLAGVLGNVTMLQGGRLDFTDSFRAACGTSEYCHLRYIYGRGVHYMSSCDDAAQDSARAWLRVALGVVHDAGHVEAACALAHAPSTAYAYEIVLVNTRAYMPRTAQWHALQNHSAPESISRLYMLFEFV